MTFLNVLQAPKKSSKPVFSDWEIEAQKALKAKDIAAVMAIKEKVDAKGERTSEKFAVGLARFLLNQRDNESRCTASCSEGHFFTTPTAFSTADTVIF